MVCAKPPKELTYPTESHGPTGPALIGAAPLPTDVESARAAVRQAQSAHDRAINKGADAATVESLRLALRRAREDVGRIEVGDRPTSATQSGFDSGSDPAHLAAIRAEMEQEVAASRGGPRRRLAVAVAGVAATVVSAAAGLAPGSDIAQKTATRSPEPTRRALSVLLTNVGDALDNHREASRRADEVATATEADGRPTTSAAPPPRPRLVQLNYRVDEPGWDGSRYIGASDGGRHRRPDQAETPTEVPGSGLSPGHDDGRGRR